ncbi:MAG: M23 family metallopeptidase [Solirubrobacteraceae bacterium]|nr:M23 family metallopeptidase [Solirubrobacteraceae bacterium]
MAPLVLVPLVLAALLGWVGEARAQRWQPPLDRYELAAPYRFDARTPYAAGARRGARLAASAGTPVRAVCSGPVTFAGRHPRLGPGVAIRCGELVATELGLASLTVRRGEWVRAGALIGRLGASGRLQLGARRAVERDGYRDPLALFEPGHPVPPSVVPSPPRARRVLTGGRPPGSPETHRRTSSNPAYAPSPAPVPAAETPVRATELVSSPAPARAPLLAWLGAALLGLGACGRAAWRTSFRRRSHVASRRAPVGA